MPHTITKGHVAKSATYEHHVVFIPVVALGMSLGLFLLIAYLGCVFFYFLFPDLFLNHVALSLLLPGFKLLDGPSFMLGLIESFGYGWVVALVFGPLFNFFSARLG